MDSTTKNNKTGAGSGTAKAKAQQNEPKPVYGTILSFARAAPQNDAPFIVDEPALFKKYYPGGCFIVHREAGTTPAYERYCKVKKMEEARQEDCARQKNQRDYHPGKLIKNEDTVNGYSDEEMEEILVQKDGFAYGRGVYFYKPAALKLGRGKGEITLDKVAQYKLCSYPFYLLASVSDARSEYGWGALIAAHTMNGDLRFKPFPFHKLSGAGGINELMAHLQDLGVLIDPRKKDLLLDYVLRTNPIELLRSLPHSGGGGGQYHPYKKEDYYAPHLVTSSSSGWVQVDKKTNRWAFVTPDWPITKDFCGNLSHSYTNAQYEQAFLSSGAIYQAANGLNTKRELLKDCRGELSEYQKLLAPLKKNPHLLLFHAASFMTVLLPFLGVIKGGTLVGIIGKSSLSKSVANELNQAAHGESKDILGFVSTGNAIVALCKLASGMGVALDDLSGASKEVLENLTELIYIIGNGTTKMRCDPTGKLVLDSNFSLVITYTGEHGLDAYIQKNLTKDNGALVAAGRDVRKLELAWDAGIDFSDMPGFDKFSSAQQADRYRAMIATISSNNGGIALHSFIQYVLRAGDFGDWKSKLAKSMAKLESGDFFTQQKKGTRLSRVSSNWARLALTAETLIELGIWGNCGLAAGDGIAAMEHCYKKWIDSELSSNVTNALDSEQLTIVDKFNHCLTVTSVSKFVQRHSNNQYGRDALIGIAPNRIEGFVKNEFWGFWGYVDTRSQEGDVNYLLDNLPSNQTAGWCVKQLFWLNAPKWKQLCAELGLSPRKVGKFLKEQGVLIPPKDDDRSLGVKLKFSYALTDAKFYVLDAGKLAALDAREDADFDKVPPIN